MFLQEMRRDRKEILVVDTGDLLHSRSARPSPGTRQIALAKADLYMRAYNVMGYDAFLPGEMDLSFGVENLIKMSKQARFPFVLANLIDVKSNKPVFPSFTIKEIKGVRIGIMGLISNQLPLGIPDKEKDQYQVRDPFQMAPNIIAEMKKQNCRVIIAMAHMEKEEQERLGREFAGIDLILSGHLNYYIDPEKSDRTQIFFAGARGENLGEVDFVLENDHLNSRFRRIPLTTQYADDPRMQAYLKEYKEKIKKLSEPPLPAEPHKMPEKRGETTRTPLYVGEKSCASCHPGQFLSWKQTAHARAYRTLVQKKQTSDPICVSCHTTGFGAQKRSGTELLNVQCEACHGPGEGHPDQRKTLGKISEALCRQCHNPANSPNFKYSDYLEKVRHR